MDSARKSLEVPCFIGETKFKAGIFLSENIARKKAYFKDLQLFRFPNYLMAKERFMEIYGEFIEEDFCPNKLYEVRSKKIYSVFSTPYFVGVVETEKSEMIDFTKVTKDVEKIRWQDYLLYENAIKIAKEKFVRIWKNPNLYIHQRIPVNTVILLDDIKKRNGIIS